ncbi:tetratricopeptide repeat protein, partial [Actinomyces sp. oral taxon 877 str. F0543]
EGALEATREAAGLYRTLATESPAAHTPDLAMSLNNLANCLSAVGESGEALEAAREAVGLYRGLAEAAPRAYMPDLATSLNTLANRLSAVGDREGALEAAREAVGLYRGLAEAAPRAYMPDLAGSLNNLASFLSEAGQREEALAVFIENFDHFSPATRAYLLLARASWRDDDEEDDLTAAAREADAADTPAFLGPVRQMIAHAVADSGLKLEGLPPWATVTIDPTMRGRLNAWLNCNDLSERADLVEATWSSPSDSERAAVSAAAELYVDVPSLRELAAVVDGIAEDGLEAVVTCLRCLHRSQVLAADWYNAHMNGRGAQYLHEHMNRGSDAPQRDDGSDEGSKEEPKEWDKGLYDPSVRAEVLQVLASGLPEAAADEMRSILALAELSDPGTAYAAHTSDEGAEDALKEFLEARNWRAMVAVIEVRPGMGDSPYGRVAAVLAAAAGGEHDGRMRGLMDYASEKLDAVDRRLVEALVDVALRTKDCPAAFADLRNWFK